VGNLAGPLKIAQGMIFYFSSGSMITEVKKQTLNFITTSYTNLLALDVQRDRLPCLILTLVIYFEAINFGAILSIT
jgi:hypothetical protein